MNATSQGRRTQVAIIGAGPAGLMLSHRLSHRLSPRLSLSGTDSVVAEALTRTAQRIP
ncbi:FAD-dependent monooxygenase [Nocardiopsis listeri]|uniref:FAD-dependent monooxygenase n=1 Tax=Nocardiopsis listeri TaxID=53440 RepID=UPI000B27EE17|nr:FAD-dependent monooxygenase [Nocardiopsis listeri]